MDASSTDALTTDPSSALVEWQSDRGPLNLMVETPARLDASGVVDHALETAGWSVREAREELTEECRRQWFEVKRRKDVSRRHRQRRRRRFAKYVQERLQRIVRATAPSPVR